MSSPRLPVPAPSDASAALRDALSDVCEQSFFAMVEACTPERFAELVEQIGPAAEPVERGARPVGRAKPSEWLKASVAFYGPFGGAIEVILPERLARSLVASLLGEPADAPMPEHRVFDGIGEFANMVCGAWLTGMSERAFGLRQPAVTRMAPGWTPLTETPTGDERTGHRLCVNDVPVRVRLRALAD